MRTFRKQGKHNVGRNTNGNDVKKKPPPAKKKMKEERGEDLRQLYKHKGHHIVGF